MTTTINPTPLGRLDDGKPDSLRHVPVRVWPTGAPAAESEALRRQCDLYRWPYCFVVEDDDGGRRLVRLVRPG